MRPRTRTPVPSTALTAAQKNDLLLFLQTL